MFSKAANYITVLLVLTTIPAAAIDILPCAVGNRWEYDSVKLVRASIEYRGRIIATLKDPSSGSCVYAIAEKDADTFDYTESTSMRSLSGQNDFDKTVIKIIKEGEGIRIVSSARESSNAEDSDKQTYDPPLLYYSKDAASGKPWEIGTMRDGETSTVLSAHAGGRETVTVPAGTFKDCLKVIYSSDNVSGTMDVWNKTFTIISGRSRGIYWVAEGVGVVKELEVSTSKAQAPGPMGGFVTVEAASCIVNELKPGYVVK